MNMEDMVRIIVIVVSWAGVGAWLEQIFRR